MREIAESVAHRLAESTIYSYRDYFGLAHLYIHVNRDKAVSEDELYNFLLMSQEMAQREAIALDVAFWRILACQK